MRRTAALALVAVVAAAGLAPVVRAEDAAAPQVSVAVAVVPERPAANETIRVSYTFTGPGSGGALRVPPGLPLKNLVLVGGPQTSTHVQMYNMNFSRSVSVTYFLRPSGAGPAEVGETTFEVGGKPVKAAAATLEVGPARAAAAVPDQSDEDDPFAGMFPRMRGTAPGLAPGRSREPAILEYLATPEKSTAYVGEEVVITYELVTQVDVDGLEPVEPPKFPGCWAEDLERPERPQGVRGTWEGKPVLRFLLQKKIVSGLAAGTLTLPPARVRLSVRGAGDPFTDPLGFARRQVVDRATKPIEMKILPVPGVTGDFKGPIGKFDVSARLDPPQVAAGSATTLKVRIAGSGNLRTATDPPQVAVPGARLYPPTRSGEPQRGAGKTTQSVEWHYVLVPEAPGALTIAPISLQVFDPAARRVVTRTTAPLTLAVAAGAVAAAPTPPGTSGNAVVEESPLAAAPPLKSAKGAAPTPTASAPVAVDMRTGRVTLPLWLLAAVPGGLVVAGAAVVLLGRRRRRRGALLAAVAPEPDETKERAAARIEHALRARLASRGVADGLPAQQIPDALRAAGEPEARVAEVRDLLEDLEFLRFAPQLGEYGDRVASARRKAARLLPKLR